MPNGLWHKIYLEYKLEDLIDGTPRLSPVASKLVTLITGFSSLFYMSPVVIGTDFTLILKGQIINPDKPFYHWGYTEVNGRKPHYNLEGNRVVKQIEY
jgi:hypothetical protein